MKIKTNEISFAVDSRIKTNYMYLGIGNNRLD
jgi:hypothetical protein